MFLCNEILMLTVCEFVKMNVIVNCFFAAVLQYFLINQYNNNNTQQ